MIDVSAKLSRIVPGGSKKRRKSGSPHWTISAPGSFGKPRKRRIQSGDLDLGCLRSVTFARTKETAPLSPRGQSKQPNATTSPDTAFELSRRRQLPPFAAVYTREPSTHCGQNAPTASGNDGFAAHLSRLASLSPGLSSRRPFTSRWGQQLAEVTAVAEHQVADDDQAPAISQRLESQIDRAARAWGVHAHPKTNCDMKISRSSLQPIA